MKERSQGAIEYLLMLAATLIVVASVTYLLFTSSDWLGGDVETRIDDVLKDVIEALT